MLWPLGKTRQEALESVHKLPEGISTTRLASSSDSCIPSERGPCYVGSTASSSIGVVQMRRPRSKVMAWAGHFQGGVPVAECSIQFNSIYFKTHNIKKQAIQIIISHMVRMKYN